MERQGARGGCLGRPPPPQQQQQPQPVPQQQQVGQWGSSGPNNGQPARRAAPRTGGPWGGSLGGPTGISPWQGSKQLEAQQPRSW